MIALEPAPPITLTNVPCVCGGIMRPALRYEAVRTVEVHWCLRCNREDPPLRALLAPVRRRCSWCRRQFSAASVADRTCSEDCEQSRAIYAAVAPPSLRRGVPPESRWSDESRWAARARALRIPLEQFYLHAELGERYCKGHRAWEPESAFGKNRNRPDGVATECRERARELSRERWARRLAARGQS